MSGKPGIVGVYVCAVVLAAVGALGAAVPSLLRMDIGAYATPLVLFTILYVISELFPIRVYSRTDEGSFTTSESFALALILSVPLPLALVVFPIGSLIGDLRPRTRRPLVRALFNAAMLTLAYGASGLVLRQLAARGHTTIAEAGVDVTTLLALVLASSLMILLNLLLVGIAITLDRHTPLLEVLRSDLTAIDLLTHVVLIGLAPIFVVVTEEHALLAPLLFGLVAGVYRSTAAARRRQHESLHDSLTELPNRRFVDGRLGELATAARRQRASFALLLIDLDRFKEVNDTLGHHIGDELLCEVGSRLRDIPGLDTVGRLGGDEFAILLAPPTTGELARHAADAVQTALGQPFVIQGLPVHIGASVGVALYPDHGTHVASVLRRADSAMYAAKRSGVGFSFARPGPVSHGPGRVSLISDLERAIENGELRLRYQPQVAVSDLSLRGFEALLRWDHPELGAIPPNQFVPMVEHTDLIGPLTDHVLRTALEARRTFLDHGLAVTLGVNISTRDLQDVRFPERVANLCAAAGLSPAGLDLEITENALMVDRERGTAVLEELRAMGLSASIDDFGTGYSSLAYLRSLPVDAIKLDRSFVHGVASSPQDAHIVRTLTELAHGMGQKVVAEGVEREADRLLLHSFGCDILQGWLVSRAMDLDDAIAWANGARPAVPTPPAAVRPALRVVEGHP